MLRRRRGLHVAFELIGDHAAARFGTHLGAAIAARERFGELLGAFEVLAPAALGVVERGEAGPGHHVLAEALAFENARERRLKKAETRRERAGVGALQFVEEIGPDRIGLSAHFQDAGVAASEAFKQFLHLRPTISPAWRESLQLSPMQRLPQT